MKKPTISDSELLRWYITCDLKPRVHAETGSLGPWRWYIRRSVGSNTIHSGKATSWYRALRDMYNYCRETHGQG